MNVQAPAQVVGNTVALPSSRTAQRCEREPDHRSSSTVRLEDELGQAKDMIAELERKLAASQDDLISTRALLKTKSAELRDAQVFLTRVDDASDGEVVNLIGLLNSSIFQTSANIAAKFQPAYGRTKNRTMRNRYIEHLRSSQLLSRKLLSSLDCLDHHQNPIVVQFALQAIMASVAQRHLYPYA
ncbi:hypothetical protein ACG7TL_008308 [Trametes sanguinea]